MCGLCSCTTKKNPQEMEKKPFLINQIFCLLSKSIHSKKKRENNCWLPLLECRIISTSDSRLSVLDFFSFLFFLKKKKNYTQSRISARTVVQPNSHVVIVVVVAVTLLAKWLVTPIRAAGSASRSKMLLMLWLPQFTLVSGKQEMNLACVLRSCSICLFSDK